MTMRICLKIHGILIFRGGLTWQILFIPMLMEDYQCGKAIPCFHLSQEKKKKWALQRLLLTAFSQLVIFCPFFFFSFCMHKFEACLTVQCCLIGRIDIQRKLFCSIQLVSFTCWAWCIIVLLLHVDWKELTFIWNRLAGWLWQVV